MREERHFGIGCFVFQLRDPKSDPKLWPDALEQTLNAIPGVSKVNILVLEGDLEDCVNPNEPDRSLDPQVIDFIWPQPGFADIQFEVSVPTVPGSPDSQSEQFFVRTLYGWYGPCTFITREGPFDWMLGASAVTKVRTFLEDSIPDTAPVAFSSISPSPFPADCELRPAHEPQKQFEFKRVKNVAYPHYTFEYDYNEFERILAADGELQYLLSAEIQAFYYLTRMKSRRRRITLDLYNRVVDYSRKHRERGIVAYVKRIFSTGHEARNLGLEILEANLLAQEDQVRADRDVVGLRSTSAHLGAFDSVLEEKKREDFSRYIENARQVILLAESSRSKDLEIAVVAASTTLGGLAGAAAALIAGG